MVDNPYFVKNGTEKSYYGADGTWYKKKIILANPGVLCRFENVVDARSMARSLCGRGITVSACKGSTLKKDLGLSEQSWRSFVEQMSVGQSSQEPQDGICPAQVSDPPSAEAPAFPESFLEPVSTSEAVAKEVNETEFIQKATGFFQQLQELAVMLDDINAYHEDLLSRTDKAIQDELHFMEFMTLDIQRAYRSYRRIHELRVRRRQIKNEILVANLICTEFNMSPESLFEAAKKAARCIEGLKTRLYTPRAAWPVEDDCVNYPNIAKKD